MYYSQQPKRRREKHKKIYEKNIFYTSIINWDSYFSSLVERLEQAAGRAALVVNNVQANPDFPDVKLGCEQMEALPQLPELRMN